MTDEAARGQRDAMPRHVGTTHIARPLLAFRFALDRSGWRVGPGWSVVLGAIAGGWHLNATVDYLQLVAVWLLADVAWGQLARLATLDQSENPVAAPIRVGIPYWQEGAPAARLARQVRSGSGTDSVGFTGDLVPLLGLLAGLCLTVALSIALGGWTMIWSAVATVCCALAWLQRSKGIRPGLVGALFAAGLPWSLGVLAFSRDGHLPLTLERLAIGLAFSLILWGGDAPAGDARRSIRLWLGIAVVVAALVVQRDPVGVAATLLLLAPIMVSASRRDPVLGSGSEWEINTPWALAALAAAAVAVL